MRDKYYTKKEGVFYFVYMRTDNKLNSDVKLSHLVAITAEQAEANRLAAPIYIEAQALAAKVLALSPEVAKAAAPMIQDVGITLWQVMKSDPLLEQDEIKEHIIEGELYRPVRYWNYY